MKDPFYSVLDDFAFRSSDDSLSSTLPNESSSADTADSHLEDENTSLPYPFIIKDSIIRNSVLAKLEKNITLNESDRKSICMGIYDECTKYT